MYKGEVDWLFIGKIKENLWVYIFIFGNGDIDSFEKVKLYWECYGVDGIMIGWAVIGYFWIFWEIKYYFVIGELLFFFMVEECVVVVRVYFEYFVFWKGVKFGVLEMCCYYINYFWGFCNIKEYWKCFVIEENLVDFYVIFNEIEVVYGNEEVLV